MTCIYNIMEKLIAVSVRKNETAERKRQEEYCKDCRIVKEIDRAECYSKRRA